MPWPWFFNVFYPDGRFFFLTRIHLFEPGGRLFGSESLRVSPCSPLRFIRILGAYNGWFLLEGVEQLLK